MSNLIGFARSAVCLFDASKLEVINQLFPDMLHISPVDNTGRQIITSIHDEGTPTIWVEAGVEYDQELLEQLGYTYDDDTDFDLSLLEVIHLAMIPAIHNIFYWFEVYEDASGYATALSSTGETLKSINLEDICV